MKQKKHYLSILTLSALLLTGLINPVYAKGKVVINNNTTSYSNSELESSGLLNITQSTLSESVFDVAQNNNELIISVTNSSKKCNIHINDKMQPLNINCSGK
jgi:hypothetical protein